MTISSPRAEALVNRLRCAALSGSNPPDTAMVSLMGRTIPLVEFLAKRHSPSGGPVSVPTCPKQPSCAPRVGKKRGRF